MSYVSVCKNVIAANNKRGWKYPAPPIRVSKTAQGKAVEHAHTLAIVDKAGNVVATIYSSIDGKPVLKCGAKVAIVTEYDTQVLA